MNFANYFMKLLLLASTKFDSRSLTRADLSLKLECKGLWVAIFISSHTF